MKLTSKLSPFFWSNIKQTQASQSLGHKNRLGLSCHLDKLQANRFNCFCLLLSNGYLGTCVVARCVFHRNCVNVQSPRVKLAGPKMYHWIRSLRIRCNSLIFTRSVSNWTFFHLLFQCKFQSSENTVVKNLIHKKHKFYALFEAAMC